MLLVKVTQHISWGVRTPMQVWVFLTSKPGHPNGWGTLPPKIAFFGLGQRQNNVESVTSWALTSTNNTVNCSFQITVNVSLLNKSFTATAERVSCLHAEPKEFQSESNY